MNTKNKGQRKETLCANELEAAGYEILFKSCTVKRGPCWVGLDFADIYDIVAATPGLLRFISCKHETSGSIAGDRRRIEAFAKEYADLFKSASFEMWIWRAPRYRGRGKAKHWDKGGWTREVIDGAPDDMKTKGEGDPASGNQEEGKEEEGRMKK